MDGGRPAGRGGGAPAPVRLSRIRVLGAPVDAIPLDRALDRVAGWVAARETRTGVAVNAHKLALARRDPVVARALETADLVVADGVFVVLTALPRRVTRLPGVELAAALLDRAAAEGWRVALVGGAPEVAAALAGPNRLTLHGYLPDRSAVAGAVRAYDPDLLLVGLGSPLQERFLDEHRGLARFSLGVGGSLDVMAGLAPRAPAWARRSGLEGAWRIAREPRKRWRRLLDPLVALR